MATPRHLRNAPITEALIDIRVKLPSNVAVDTFGSLHGLISSEYPHERKRRRVEDLIEFKDGEAPKHTAQDKGIDGYVYLSADNKQVVQFRLDGFTFSRLKPYETWEHLRDEARRLWSLYVDTASPEVITRVALRYINHLEFPFPSVELSDYLTAPPVVPQNLPQVIRTFLSRVVIDAPSLGASAVITQALDDTSAHPNVVPIILDIDVFKEGQLAIDGNEAWDILNKLRDFKNEIFFGSITEKTVELYI
jgi:uncharacterized protein (TIGR04255 family)